jgi:single-strand DNA-binding protein
MSMSYNRSIIAGNLTRDPQTRFLANEKCVCSFTVANTRRFTVAGEKREETAFVDCEAWGKTAEIIGRFFTKSKPILVEGRLKQDNWDDKDTGKKRSKLVVVVDSFDFVPDGKRDTTEAPAGTTTPRRVTVEDGVTDGDANSEAPRKPAVAAPGGDEPPF